MNLKDFSLEINQEIEKVEWQNKEIEVKQYLPIEKKLEMISRIINSSIDDNGYYNPAKVYIFTIIEIINEYSNIDFTEENMENIFNLYDLLVSTGLSAKIYSALNPFEIQQIQSWISELITSIYQYKNSIVGIFDIIKEDYSGLELDAEKIQDLLGNKEDLQLLHDVMTKMG